MFEKTMLRKILTFIILQGHMLVSKNLLASGLACHILVCVCLLVSNFNLHGLPEKLRLSRDTTGI